MYVFKIMKKNIIFLFQGTRIIRGSSASNIQNQYVIIPKTFIYGTYKVRLSYTDKNKKIMGCFIMIVEIKRPWESY